MLTRNFFSRTVILTTILTLVLTGTMLDGQAEAHHKTDDMDAVSLAEHLLGEEFTSGGENPDKGFNSSGLTHYIYNKIGYDNFPRSLDSQYSYKKADFIDDISDLKYGDALFFGKKGDPSFAGIYIGNRRFIYASKSNDKVVKRYLDKSYRELFIGARRVLTKEDHLRIKIILKAKQYLGTPYDFGADYGQTGTFDCSSFTKWVFAKNGTNLPRVSRDQSRRGDYVSKSNLKAGDLVFFTTRSRKDRSGTAKIGHVGIYAGNGKMIHTYGKGGVKYSSIASGYWEDAYIKARRVIN